MTRTLEQCLYKVMEHMNLATSPDTNALNHALRKKDWPLACHQSERGC